MHSKIIERILDGDNKSLSEIIEIVQNNAIFLDVMSDIKEEFFINDSIHGISHNERVALLACYIALQENLNNKELRLVLEAAKYHDIGRGFEGNHGQYSAIIIDRNKEHIFPNLSDDEINIIKALCHGHSVDDKRYIEIAKIYGIENIEKFKKLLNIVKDADALDRVRLPRFGKLDTSFLRTTTARNIPDVAELLYREYLSIQKQIRNQTKETEVRIPNTYRILKNEKERLLFDGQNYYLIRSLNKYDIDSLDNGDGTIIPRGTPKEEYTVDDIINQVQMFRNKTGLISMSEDANVALTYDRSNLHRFALVKIPESEIENYKKVFQVGDYLLNVMNNQIESISENAPENVKQILSAVDKATSVQKIIQIINGANRQVSTSLIETEQQYLTDEEQLEQSKKIAKCQVLHYYGLMREVIPGKNISEYTAHIRMGYSSAEWLHVGEINSENIVQTPKILVETLSLLKQAEFQGIDKEQLKIIEQRILNLVNSGIEIEQENYQSEYSLHNHIKQDLSIDRAFELTNGEISYRDTNIQMMAIRSFAEMTLNKRAILNFLSQEFPEIDVEQLLKNTYCINPELTTRTNNKGNQIGRNVNLLIANYGYALDNEISSELLSRIEDLSIEQLNDIVINGVNSQEIERLLVKTRENGKRIQSFKTKTTDSKYMAEAIIEGYNWRKEGNSLTIKERELLANKLLSNVTNAQQLYTLYEAINKIQIGRNKFTQNEIFAIIINMAIDGKIGDIFWRDLLGKELRDIQNILLDNKEQLQTSVLPISIDLLAGRGREIDNLKREVIALGIDKEFIDSKAIKNVYVAKQIIDGYDFGREINKAEKAALIKAILDRSKLNKKVSYYLARLIQNMEKIGLDTQEIYGMIINLGVNRRLIEEKGYSYISLLNNVNNTRELIKEYKSNIHATVTEGTINRALSENLSEAKEKKIKTELTELGLDIGFIELKDIKNIYFAKKIVEDYNFEREINKEERVALIKDILDISKLNKKGTCYLGRLIQNMEQIGLSTQEIYGMIINLGVNGIAIEETEYFYTNLLSNKNNACQTIAQYKDKIKTKVTEDTINRALSENLSEAKEKKIKTELIELGLDIGFIESRDIRNIYFAKKIVEDYNFEREINKEEKAALIKAVLNDSQLHKKRKSYLATLIQNMEQIGLSTQEIYGMVINLGVNGTALEETGYIYSNLLSSNNTCENIKRYKDKIKTKVTEGTINRALSENLSEAKEKKIKIELTELGLDIGFIESKDIRNIYFAKKIVEDYNFEREINKEERAALIKAVLNNSQLHKKRKSYLVTLIQNMEQIGLSTQEIYGMVINLGVNGIAIEETGYAYSDLLSNKNSSCETIKRYKDKIKTKVTEGTINRALSENLSEAKEKKIKTELTELGLDIGFIESKDIRNIYFAKKIVEDYNFEREINKEEKAALIKAVLNNSQLNKKSRSYLGRLIQNMEQIGLSTQEIYGMVINLGVNGTVLEKIGYNYSELLTNNNTCENIKRYKDKIKMKVTEGTINRALSENLSEAKEKKIKTELTEFGLDIGFIESKDIRNIYFAKKIVEDYNFEREINKEEKAALIKVVVNNSLLNKKGGKYLATLIQNMEQIGLSTQEIYGMIINLGVNGIAIEETEYFYTNLLSNTKNSCKTIAQYKDEIQTQVTEDTIQKAVKKANKQKKIKGKDIAEAAMELLVAGNSGSEICDEVQDDYQRLLNVKIKEKEGSEQDVPN